MEARVGIEPTHKGFADLSLTTWVPRPRHKNSPKTTLPAAKTHRTVVCSLNFLAVSD